MNGRIQIRVAGVPIPQGSKTIANPYAKNGRPAYLRDDNPNLEAWRTLVTDVARDTCRYHETITVPVKVWLRFTFERPKSHYRSGRNAHRLTDRAPLGPTVQGCGDLDKLTRSIFDSLTKAQVWADDSLVVDVRARKVYAGEDELALPKAGVVIVLEPLEVPATVPASGDEAVDAGAVHTIQEALL